MRRDVSPNSWTPVPIRALSSMWYLGARNTSPCTNFQPDSSKASSCKQKCKWITAVHLLQFKSTNTHSISLNPTRHVGLLDGQVRWKTIYKKIRIPIKWLPFVELAIKPSDTKTLQTLDTCILKCKKFKEFKLPRWSRCYIEMLQLCHPEAFGASAKRPF